MFSLGEAASLLAVLELYQIRLKDNLTWLVFYTFLVMTAASYSAGTKFFLPLAAVYAVLLIALTRAHISRLALREKAPYRAWKVAVFSLLAASFAMGMVLRHYREPLNNWNLGAVFQGQNQATGFSHFTRLGSKDIVTSRQPVLHYFAKRGIYHLRGGVYDRQKQEGGHCEMFASALVMLVRAQGIPARYITGYYAHEWNEHGRFITVRACDAHAWAEVFLPETGWTTVDPTPAEDLQQILKEYRGFGESWREFISEWLRRLQIPRTLAVLAGPRVELT